MMMATLTMAVLLGQAPEPVPEPSALVERLGSPRYAERERAAAALTDLGPAALDALRAGRRARDPEVRSRAAALLDRVESALMVRPTLVALEFRDRPLADVVKALSEQARIHLVLQPDNEEFWKGHRVTLEEPAPVTFWAAIDKLCAAAQLQHNPNWGQPAGQPATLHLMGGGPMGSPTCDHGPFRVLVTGLHHHRDRNLVVNGPRAVAIGDGVGARVARRSAPRFEESVNDQFYFDLQVAAEPRLLLGQGGQLKLTEAIDDLGQSLLLPATGDADTRVVHYNGFYYVGAAQTIQLQGHLQFPRQPGKSIRTLRGTVPVAVAARKPDPLVVPLAGAVGKTFRSDEATLIIHELKADPNGQGPLLELTLRDHAGSSPASGPRGEMASFQPMHNPQSQIEILDAQGHALPFYPRNTTGRPGDVRLILALMNNGEAGPPTQLRYYELVRATTEAPFEFHDLPMP